MLPATPHSAGVITSFIGTLFFILSTWLIIPTLSLSLWIVSRELITTSSKSSSKVPKPSSKKNNSRGAVPFNWICADKANANAKDARNVSPPDNVEASRPAPPFL